MIDAQSFAQAKFLMYVTVVQIAYFEFTPYFLRGTNVFL
jgi:hypothetical protein